MKKLSMFFVFMMLGWISLHAQFSGGGTGTSGDPYQLKTDADVDLLRNYLGNNGLNKHFRIMNDIEMGSYITNKYGSSGWEPIGTFTRATESAKATAFRGKLHGGGHKITGLWANRSTVNYMGLIGYLSSEGSIDSLGICVPDGKSMKGNNQTGIIVGINYGIISKCYTKGYVQGANNVGGVVGSNVGTEEQLTGKIMNSYNWAKVQGTTYCGGIAGLNKSYGIVEFCYNASEVTGTISGALVGQNMAGDILNCYFDSSKKNPSYGTSDDESIIENVLGRTSSLMKKQSSYSNWTDFTTIWKMRENCSYPYLKWQAEAPSCYVGNGTEDDPYQIWTAADLDDIRTHLDPIYQGKHFQIMQNINVSSHINTKYGSVGWKSIGDVNNQFNAYLHGGGKKITGIWMNRTSELVGGLFSYIGENGSIENLIIETASGKKMSIENGVIGTFSAYNYGSIESCANYGHVRGGGYVGGLIGKNYGSIKNSYNVGTIEGGSYIGGIAGEHLSGEINYTYNAGPTIIHSGNRGAAAIVGGTALLETILNSYFDKEVTGFEFGVSVNSRAIYTLGKTTIQMKQRNTFTGWDFNNTWKMVNNCSYPQLFFETSPANCLFAGGSGTSGAPYLISTAEHLDNVRLFLGTNTYFKVTSNINLTNYITTEYGNSGWLPIGTESDPFTGNIDGQHYKIEGLRINRPNEDNIGLFGYTYGAVISNLTLYGHTSSSIIGRNNVGMLIGNNANATINSCFLMTRSGQYILGNENVGGLIGNSLEVNIGFTSCRTAVRGNDNIGGLIGSFDAGRIEYSYAQGIVKANNSTSYSGGLIGQVWSRGMILFFTYSACIMEGSNINTNRAGTLIGTHVGAPRIQYTVYDDDLNGGEIKGAGGIELGGKLSTSQMMNTTILSEYGWIFKNVYNSLSTYCPGASTYASDAWDIVQGYTYPLLAFERRYCSDISSFQNNLLNGNISPFSAGFMPFSAPINQENVIGQESIIVYPNPTNNTVKVEGNIEGEIGLFDNNGNLLLKTVETEINLSNYPDGIYHILVNNQKLKVIKK